MKRFVRVKRLKKGKLLYGIAVMQVAAILMLAGLSAYGDFNPQGNRVLGVGRFQAQSTAVPTTGIQRLSMATSEDSITTINVSELATPIERELTLNDPIPSLPDPVEDSGTPVEIGWSIGRASAYGISDRLVGSWTALGDQVTEDSMGVAVPVAWYHLLGHTIEIEYNGIVVTAIINDTGGFAGYGRSLDLQPGVFKAFGFDNDDDWGVRTVRYRIID